MKLCNLKNNAIRFFFNFGLDSKNQVLICRAAGFNRTAVEHHLDYKIKTNLLLLASRDF